MKAIITSTPEVELELINSVCEILSASIGPISFQTAEPVNSRMLKREVEKYSTPQSIEVLTSDELFSICAINRDANNLEDQDFLVLLTSIKTAEEWLSFSNGGIRDLVVDTNDWDEYSNVDSKFGIAHQIVASIFHSFLKYSAVGILDENSTHKRSVGCLMDYCDERSDVMYKLRTGYICPDCVRKALDRSMSKEVLVQLHSIIQRLRTDFIQFEFLQSLVEPLKLHVDKQLNITVGDKMIDLQPLPKTLYLYFLEMTEQGGVVKDTMNNDSTKEVMTKLYRLIRKGGEIEKIYSLCLDYDDPNSTFKFNKSILNKRIKEVVGKDLSPFYIISTFKTDGGTIFKLDINPNYIQLEYNK